MSTDHQQGKTYLNYLCRNQDNSVSAKLLDAMIYHEIKWLLIPNQSNTLRALDADATFADIAECRAELAAIEDEAQQIIDADLFLTDRLNLLAQIKTRRERAEKGLLDC